MKRRVIFADIAINISIIILFLTILLVLFMSNKMLNIHMLNNGFYSSNKHSFNILANSSTFDEIKSMYSKFNESTILYKELAQDEDLRGVLLKGAIEEPPIIEGRFFNENDFYKGKHYAIVGRNQKDQIYKIGSHSFIDIGEHPYEIIGIVGSKKDKSLLDYSIYVNLDSLSEVSNTTGLYHLDGISDERVKKTLAQFETDIIEINLMSYGILNAFYRQIPSFSLLICLGLAFISFYIFFSYMWFYSHHKLIEVMDIIGFSSIQKLKKTTWLYTKTILPSLILCAIICVISFY